ncbi:hypothetical protein G6F52_012410 [Rhizopus delemar]|nr:hypothetical protein G6F52_012410 [Rhizopus delemar]
MCSDVHPPLSNKVNPSTSITTIPSDPKSTKISSDKTTISKSRDLEITRQPLISSLRSTLPKSVPISIPSKRTIADRTPPFVPVDMSRKTIGSLKLNKDSDVTSTSNITAPHLDLTQDLNFGLSTAPKASPLTTSAPDWFLPIQAQLNRQEQLINRQGLRLSQREDVVVENQRLRTDLALARQEINELKSRLGSPIPQEQPTPMAEDFPELGTAHSKYATPTTPVARTTPRDPPVLAVSTPSQPSFLATATRGQTTTDTVVPVKVHRRRNPLTSRQRQALARSFMPVSDNQGYQYLYLPTRFREPDATAILAKSGLKPITDFDPRAESCFRNPVFASLTKEQRKEKMVDVCVNS